MLQKRTFCFGVEIGFGAAVCLAVAGSHGQASQALVDHNQTAAPRSLVLRSSVSADHIGVAA